MYTHTLREYAHRRFDTVDGSTCITDPIKLYPRKTHFYVITTKQQNVNWCGRTWYATSALQYMLQFISYHMLWIMSLN